MKADNITIREVITDKDSFVNGIFCRHFPEGTITYCSNHRAKALQKDLQKIKEFKCEVSYCTSYCSYDNNVQLSNNSAEQLGC